MADPAQALTPRTNTNPKIEINPDGTYTPVGRCSHPQKRKSRLRRGLPSRHERLLHLFQLHHL